MIINTECKKCRRAGEKLFLKGDKCYTPKCILEKKPYPPGLPLSARKHRTMLSEYGIQLKEKQKLRNVYRLSEKQFASYVNNATTTQSKLKPIEKLYENLELRLDNVVFRLGFAGTSRGHARQMVSHGHFTVNGRRVDIPSYKVHEGDVIAVREGSINIVPFTELKKKLEKHTPPAWLALDAKAARGTVQGVPRLDKNEMTFNLTSILEFYSR